jgi:predicted DNA-binding WGR domain protein
MNRIALTTFATFLLFVAVAAQKDAFSKWKEQHKKDGYKDDKTESAARKTFNDNAVAIDKHNRDPSATYKQKPNAYSDMSSAEFEKQRTGYKEPTEDNKQNGKSVKSSSGGSKLPSYETMKKEQAENVGARVPTSLDYST